MAFHMKIKTTLNISDVVMKQLKEEAVRQGKTMSELVEMAIRKLFQQHRRISTHLPSLPSFDSGGSLVDLANRESLYETMERP
ncbi:MAG: hypothetical protein J7L53_01400 [Deltaproteobacteria bacterium]|nr:hypothetical protein [Deltaproteobacteria bacterium]